MQHEDFVLDAYLKALKLIFFFSLFTKLLFQLWIYSMKENTLAISCSQFDIPLTNATRSLVDYKHLLTKSVAIICLII